MPEQQPSIGRIVHYVDYGTPGYENSSPCRAAVITKVENQSHDEGDDEIPDVSLCVFNPNPTGVHYYADGNKAGTWHWPERT